MILQPHLYGFFMALALFSLYHYSKLNHQKYQTPWPQVELGIIWAFIFALVGARAYHIFSAFQYYALHPFSVFRVWEGGLGIFGAILGGIAGIILYSKIKHLNLLNLLNLIAPPLLLAQAIGRLGNFFNLEGFGPPTNAPWRMFVPIEYRPPQLAAYSYFHPTFFYESILCLVAFLIFLFLPKRYKENSGFAYYLVAYGIIRFSTEFFRWDTWTWSGVRVAQWLALGAGIVGLLGWWKNWQKTRR
jgi:phosphatidylglycerol:prolipoprotein diacylglycerol transferase